MPTPEEEIQELIESWINGNQSTVYKEFFNMTLINKITFLEAAKEAGQLENFNRYVRAVN